MSLEDDIKRKVEAEKARLMECLHRIPAGHSTWSVAASADFKDWAAKALRAHKSSKTDANQISALITEYRQFK